MITVGSVLLGSLWVSPMQKMNVDEKDFRSDRFFRWKYENSVVIFSLGRYRAYCHSVNFSPTAPEEANNRSTLGWLNSTTRT
ncbi:hypothetical protein CSUI_005536, partial [Cystoisospora suis]